MPQRFLRPALRTSARWNSVSRNAQALWLSILMTCDDYGRYHGRDSLLWADAFVMWNELHPNEQVPLTAVQLLKGELIREKLAEFYTFDGKQFVQLCQWTERARGESKFPAPQESAGIRSEILPPSPSPLALVPSHKPSPSGLVNEMRRCIAVAFKRGENDFWAASEEHALYEICLRPNVKAEWIELLAFRVTLGSYFPQKIRSLLEDWGGTLDRSRNQKESNATNSKTHSLNPAADRRNAGTIGGTDYGAAGKRLLARQAAKLAGAQTQDEAPPSAT